MNQKQTYVERMLESSRKVTAAAEKALTFAEETGLTLEETEEIPGTIESILKKERYHIPEPEETLIETTAHEFMHYVQKIKRKPYSEEEAERFAEFARYQVKRQIIETKAQTQPKKRHFKNPAQYIGSRKKRKKIVRGK